MRIYGRDRSVQTVSFITGIFYFIYYFFQSIILAA